MKRLPVALSTVLLKADKRNNPKSNFLLTNDAGELLDYKDQANTFVEHFSNAHGLERIPYDLSTTDDFCNRPITADELHVAIRLIKNSTPGEDGIPERVYKALFEKNKDQMLRFLNDSFLSGNVPESRISSIILPIWKVGKPRIFFISYHLIALLLWAARLWNASCLGESYIGLSLGRSSMNGILVSSRTMIVRRHYSSFTWISSKPDW